MERNEAKDIIENILFVSDAPLTIDKLVKLFEEKLTADELKSIIMEIRDDYATGALRISEVAEGWRMTTNPEYVSWITSFFKMEKGHKLTRASLETLAIIAYRQPITRAEVDDIRGVDSGGVLRGLIDKSLVRTMGRRKVPGRPMMYGTTNRFLEFFGLARLADLPTLDEFQAELGGGALEHEQAIIDFAPDENTPDEDADEFTETEQHDADEIDESDSDAASSEEIEQDDTNEIDESENDDIELDDSDNSATSAEEIEQTEQNDINEIDESENQADELGETENEILNKTEDIS